MAISTWEPSELDRWKQRAEQAEARVEQLEREVNEEWVTRGMPSWRSRSKRAEAELRDLTVEHLGSGPWCEGCGRVTNQVLSSEHPGLCNVCAELETLKARRCGGCKHWHGHNYCAEGIAEECDVPELPDHDFACNRWTPREAAE